MTNLEKIIEQVMQKRQSELAASTWEARRCYFQQILKLANSLSVTEPCQHLYDLFIADDHGSKERRSEHIRCVKMIDGEAGSGARDERGILYNELPMPAETEVQAFFTGQSYPLSIRIRMDYLIVKANMEIRYLNLSASTVGQYKHAWRDICRYFNIHDTQYYDSEMMKRYLDEIGIYRKTQIIEEWKWKINRKSAHILMEIADTGCFKWGLIPRNNECNCGELESVRLQYLDFIKKRNLSQSTMALHDYVVRKAMVFWGIKSISGLNLLSHEQVQRTIRGFAAVCSRRSMATILPILRSWLKFLYDRDLTQLNRSAMIMSPFVQRGSVASYIKKEDEARLRILLESESKRNKAILLLAICLGLRDCDICNLSFQEIDWLHDKLKITQKKTGEVLLLPLLPDVGNALMDYLLHERPMQKAQYPYVFLRKQAPFYKINSAYMICSNFLRKAGITPVNGTARGVHLFRYSMVHKLLEAKVPYPVITDALGMCQKNRTSLIFLWMKLCYACALWICQSLAVSPGKAAI
jgi:integrase